MRAVCLSDTHMQHGLVSVPDGDMVLHTGDATWTGSFGEVGKFLEWFAGLPHKHKILVAGNHDRLFQDYPLHADALLETVGKGIHYLQDNAVVVEGFVVYGSPWQPEFGSWAFNLPRGHELRAKWGMISPDVDILLTHGPPHGILDITTRGEAVGCADLLYRLGSISPKLHVFGHIHPAYGETIQAGTHFVNASICNEDYKPMNAPVVVDL